ncbi:hypothetical protein C8R43DRAFT_1108030 [Mycena crocata]|nr:hypothetical protein C8R43DRAFT_1108030 [Mycena crocata]
MQRDCWVAYSHPRRAPALAAKTRHIDFEMSHTTQAAARHQNSIFGRPAKSMAAPLSVGAASTSRQRHIPIPYILKPNLARHQNTIFERPANSIAAPSSNTTSMFEIFRLIDFRLFSIKVYNLLARDTTRTRLICKRTPPSKFNFWVSRELHGGTAIAMFKDKVACDCSTSFFAIFSLRLRRVFGAAQRGIFPRHNFKPYGVISARKLPISSRRGRNFFPEASPQALIRTQFYRLFGFKNSFFFPWEANTTEICRVSEYSTTIPYKKPYIHFYLATSRPVGGAERLGAERLSAERVGRKIARSLLQRVNSSTTSSKQLLIVENERVVPACMTTTATVLDYNTTNSLQTRGMHSDMLNKHGDAVFEGREAGWSSARIMTTLFSVSFALALAALASSSSVQAAALPHGLSFHRDESSPFIAMNLGHAVSAELSRTVKSFVLGR